MAAQRNDQIDELTPAQMSHLLTARGLETKEAWNIIALALGLRPVASGWSQHEIANLLFLRDLARHGAADNGHSSRPPAQHGIEAGA